jgi:CheY-like chemotaxis protein
MNRISLLVVDDDSALRELLLRRFSEKEFDVTTSDSGTAAIELIKTKKFDVGVLDILMPGITGTELLK